jgi:hypothetical protein
LLRGLMQARGLPVPAAAPSQGSATASARP